MRVPRRSPDWRHLFVHLTRAAARSLSISGISTSELILAVINPRVGGVLLIGARGLGKTVTVRGLIDLLPPVERSTCAA